MSDSPLPPLTTIGPDIQSLADYERLAPQYVTPEIWQHMESGAGAEKSLRGNRDQFDRYQFVPRMLRDMRGGSTAITLFGKRHSAPILLAPLAYQQLAHPDGEIAAVRAATALGTTMIVSTLSSITMEDISQAARETAQALNIAEPPPHWFQLYFQPDRSASLSLIRRAEQAGYDVIVVTVDASVKRSGIELPAGIEAANLRQMPRISQTAQAADGQILFGSALLNAAPLWDDIMWLRSVTALPLVIKGLLAPADCVLARDAGVDGVILSNHGGRVVDGLAGPLDMLEECISAVGRDFPVLIDGGVRCGADVAKALALGAHGALVGRPLMHALAVAGMQGAAHMLHILRVELEMTMAQIGAATPDALDRNLLRRTN